MRRAASVAHMDLSLALASHSGLRERERQAKSPAHRYNKGLKRGRLLGLSLKPMPGGTSSGLRQSARSLAIVDKKWNLVASRV